MDIHKPDFLINRGVGSVNRPASGFRRNGGIIVGREDDEAGRKAVVGEVEEVGDCGARAEERQVSGWVDVSVDIYHRR